MEAGLVPHLQRALRIQDHVRELCGAALDATSAVDALGHGVMILGDRGEVLHVNPAAQSVLDRADGLTVRLSRLTADCARAAVEIRTAVANALGQERDSAPAASAVVCPRPHGRPYILHVTPQCSGEAGGRARATVIVIDPQRRAEPPASLLRCLFGLTAAEADISIRLVHGAELSSIAEELTVSITTVKTHLRNIFAKTQTHRQAELIRVRLSAAV